MRPPYFHAGLLAAFLAWAAPVPAAPLSLDSLLTPSGVASVRVSPDGKRLALLYINALGSPHVKVANVDNMLVTWASDGWFTQVGFNQVLYDPVSISWLDDELLAINFEKGAYTYRVKSEEMAVKDPPGKVVVAKARPTYTRLGDRIIKQVEVGDAGQRQVLAYADMEDGIVSLFNVENGSRRRFKYPPGTPVRLAFDRQGNLRAATMADSSFWRENTTISNWYRTTLAAPWEKLADFKVTDHYWQPMHVADDGSLVIASREGRDTTAIFRYDPKQRLTGKMLAGHDREDVVAVDGIGKETFTQVQTLGMKYSQAWLDPKWERLQKSVDATLSGRVNVLSGNPDTRLVIFSYGDVDPGTWYVMHPAQMSMEPVGKLRESVDPARMRPMQSINYPTADGLTIPAFLTLPKDEGKKMPMVVLIHGGPAARDHWEWNHEVQFLASRGYVVFQPQFRGSTGFGASFEQAGIGQWGLAMQDDITAGVEHLIKLDIADPTRICIYGASYGGYAALWGLVKTPHLYKCAISFAGVTDLELMFNDASDVNSNKAGREFQRFLLGELREKQQLSRVSPLRHAERINAPVLLAHGMRDKRVPPVHSERMRDALNCYGKPVEWLEFDNEGHGLIYIKNQRQLLEKIEDFLARHLAVQ